MRKLIINADDLGMSDYVNSQIEQCIKQGVITSSTLMANAPAFEGGVRIAKQNPHISVGAHLNIIEFAPLTNKEIFQKHGMLDNNGNFIDGAAFVVSYDEELKKAVFEEWDAQISKIEKAGVSPTHCDSHEHTHTIDALQDVLCSVMDKHRITKVRRIMIPSIRLILRARRQSTVVHIDKSNSIQPAKHSLLYRRLHFFVIMFKCLKWNRVMKKRYTLTDGFCSFNDFYENRDILHLGGLSSSIEVMCHPGNPPFQCETERLMKDMSWMDENYILTPYHSINLVR